MDCVIFFNGIGPGKLVSNGTRLDVFIHHVTSHFIVVREKSGGYYNRGYNHVPGSVSVYEFRTEGEAGDGRRRVQVFGRGVYSKESDRTWRTIVKEAIACANEAEAGWSEMNAAREACAQQAKEEAGRAEAVEAEINRLTVTLGGSEYVHGFIKELSSRVRSEMQEPLNDKQVLLAASQALREAISQLS